MRASGALYPDLKQAGTLGPKKGMALVVVYGRLEPRTFFGTPTRRSNRMNVMVGAALYLVLANDAPLGRIGHNRFVTYQAAPGQVQLSTATGSGDAGKDLKGSAGSAVLSGILAGPLGAPLAIPLTMLPAAAGRKKVRTTLDVRPAETYYFKMIYGAALIPNKFVRVPAQQAEQELATCHLAAPLSQR